MTRNQEIAQTIIQQLGGGGRLVAMIGAKNFVAIESGLSFKFGACPQYNYLSITLNGMDLYDLRLVKVRAHSIVREKTVSGIYAEDLRQTIESETKLCLSL